MESIRFILIDWQCEIESRLKDLEIMQEEEKQQCVPLHHFFTTCFQGTWEDLVAYDSVLSRTCDVPSLFCLRLLWTVQGRHRRWRPQTCHWALLRRKLSPPLLWKAQSRSVWGESPRLSAHAALTLSLWEPQALKEGKMS